MQAEILNHLRKDPLQNLPVIGFFQNYPLEKRVEYGTSMILAGTSDYTWAYFSVGNPQDFDKLLEKYGYETLYFANVEEWMIPHLTLYHRIEWRLATDRYYLPDEVEVKEPVRECRALTLEDVNHIYQHSAYKDYTSVEYIKERIQKDISAGIWVDDKLIGWGLTHDDSSLGFLNVMSEYRGQGTGEDIFRSLILAKRKTGNPVFVNVEPHNKQSISLLNKLGLTFDRQVSWIKLA